MDKLKQLFYKLEQFYYSWIHIWFFKDWYSYLFEKKNRDFRSIICRFRGHPYGVVWFNSNGYEPDMSCNNCGDDRG